MIILSKLTALIALITLSFFLSTSHGYIIDKSCDPYYDSIENAMSEAFTYVHAAIDLLKNVQNSILRPRVRTLHENIILVAQKDLISFIFADIVSFDEEGRGAFNNGRWKHVMSVFQRVLRYDKSENGSPHPTPLGIRDYRYLNGVGNDEIIIFCDFLRFDFEKKCEEDAPLSHPEVCDTAYMIEREFSREEFVVRGSTEQLAAVTVNSAYFAHLGLSMPSQIQLGPAYFKNPQTIDLDRVMEDIREHLPRARASAGTIPVDLIHPGNLDGVLLHEMTHAIEPSLKTNDARLDNSLGSYGWMAVSEMSGFIGSTNADSFTLFALIANLITPPTTENTPMRVTREGNVLVLPREFDITAKRDIEHSIFDTVSSRSRRQSSNEVV